MNKARIWLLVGCVEVALCLGCAGPEEKVGTLLAEASHLVHSAHDAQQTSYADAFELYQQALAKAETIAAQYPSSQVATKLTQGEAKLGSYTLTELKDTVVPLTRSKAAAEASPFICALLVARTEPTYTETYVDEDTGEQISEEDASERQTAEEKVVVWAAQAGQCAQLLPIVGKTEEWPLAEIARQCAAAGQYEPALAAASLLENAGVRASALAEIANSYARAGQNEKAAELLSHAIELARTCTNSTAVLTEMARKSAQVGQSAQAAQIVHTLEDENARAELWADLAYAYLRVNHYDQALKTAEELADDRPAKAEVLAALARTSIDAGHYDQALQVAGGMMMDTAKANVLADIAGKCAEAGQKEKAAEVLLQALRVAETEESPAAQAESLAIIGFHYAKTGQQIDGSAKQVLHDIVAGLYEEAKHEEPAETVRKQQGGSWGVMRGLSFSPRESQ